MRKHSFFGLCAMLALNACATNSPSKENPEILAGNHPLHAHLVLDTLKHKPIQIKFNTAGEIQLLAGHYAQIGTPFSGRVVKSYVKLGQKVKKGDPVFEVSSSEYFNIQQNFFTAEEEYKQAELALHRQKALMTQKVGAHRDLEEATANFEIKKFAYLNSKEAIQIFGETAEKIKLGKPLTIYAPIGGEVIAYKLIIGQFLKEDQTDVLAVADLSKVWAVAQIKEKDIAFIQSSEEVRMQVLSYGDKIFQGKVAHIGQFLDESSRSLQVLVLFDNAYQLLKPGMYATLNFTEDVPKALVVPSQTVLQDGNDRVVFVKTAENTYQKRKVLAYGLSAQEDWIQSGLQAGEVVVVSGAVYLQEH
jgi:membrane fusion protein, heavy metal efflux system